MPLSSYTPTIDNRRYDDILAEARTRIPRYTQEWTDFNDSDPGMALVQLFAWMTDMMLYRLGRVPEMNYIKFLELLGIDLRPAQPSAVDIVFPVRESSSLPYVIVPKRTRVSAEDPDGPAPIVFETDRTLVAIAAKLDSLQSHDGYTFRDLSQLNQVGLDAFHPFGMVPKEDCCLYLGFKYSREFPQVELALNFVCAEANVKRPYASGQAVLQYLPARIVWEYWDGAQWRALSLLKDETAALTESGQVYLKTPAEGLMRQSIVGEITDERYWIRARLLQTKYQIVPQILSVSTNTVKALQAQTSKNEVLGGSNGRPDQILKLTYSPVLAGTLKLEVNEGDGFVEWKSVEDFFASTPTDKHYVLDRTTGEIRFGNGKNGAIPVGNNALVTSNIVAREYRYGGGARGNVAARAVKNLLTSIVGIDDNKVSNLRAAVGGSDEETLDEAKRRAPRTIKSRGRAVTLEDFEYLATESGDIRRAKALPLAHPDFPGIEIPGAVSVIVVPNSEIPNPTPSDALMKSLVARLNEVRLVTTELYVVPPSYRKVRIFADIVAADSADLGELKDTLNSKMLSYFHPLRGGEDEAGWSFGGDIFYSKVYTRLSIPGVERVENLVITVDGREGQNCSNIPICPGELVYSTEHDLNVSYSFDE